MGPNRAQVVVVRVGGHATPNPYEPDLGPASGQAYQLLNKNCHPNPSSNLESLMWNIYHDIPWWMSFDNFFWENFEDFQPCLFFWGGRPRYSTQDRLVSATRCRKRPIDYQCPNSEAKRPKAYRSNDVEVHGTSNLNGGGLHTSGLLNLVLVAKKMLYVEWDCFVGIAERPSEVWLLFFLHDGKHPAVMDENGILSKRSVPLQSDHLWHSWLIEGKYPKLNRGRLLGGTSSCSSNLGYIWSAECLKFQSLGDGLPIARLVWIPPVVVVFQLFQHCRAYSQIAYHPIRHDPIHTLHPNPLRW